MPDVVVVGSINADLVVRAARLPGPGETVDRRHVRAPRRRQGRQPGGRGGAAGRARGARRRRSATTTSATRRCASSRAEGIDVAAVARLADVADGRRADRGRRARGEPDRGRLRAPTRELDGAFVAAALARLAAGVVLLALEVGDAALLARRARRAGGSPSSTPRRRASCPRALLDARPAAHAERGRGARPHRRGGPRAAARALRERTGAPVLVTLGARRRAARSTAAASPCACPRRGRRRRHHRRRRLPQRRAGRGARRAARRSRTRWRFAVRAAALSTLRRGARDGMPTRAAVTRRGEPGYAARRPAEARAADATPPRSPPTPRCCAPRARHRGGARAARASRSRSSPWEKSTPASVTTPTNASTSRPSSCVPDDAAQLRDGVLDGDRRAVGVARGHHVERVADGEDARQQRDLRRRPGCAGSPRRPSARDGTG